MARHVVNARCDICGGDKPCTYVKLFRQASSDTVEVKPFTGSRGVMFPGEFPMMVCNDCGREKGKTPKKAWIFWIIGCILMTGGIVLLATSGSGNGAVAPLALLTGAGWITSVISGNILLFKRRFEKSTGGIGLTMFLSFYPPLSMIMIAAMGKSINRCAGAFVCAKAEGQKKLNAEAEQTKALAEKEESGAALTEEEEKLLEETKLKEENAKREAEYVRAENEEKQRKSGVTGAVLGVLFTLVIGIWGASVYSSGRGYMTFFNIELSPGGFAALIAAFIIWDVIFIVSAVRMK